MQNTVIPDGEVYSIRSPYTGIDESKLTMADRLGLAYCRLCSGEWDELLGPEPAHEADEIAYRKMAAIKTIIGEADTSRCWWKFNLKRTEDEWRAWYGAKYSDLSIIKSPPDPSLYRSHGSDTREEDGNEQGEEGKAPEGQRADQGPERPADQPEQSGGDEHANRL